MLEADLTKEDDCQKMAETAVDRYGRLDVLVNNVGSRVPRQRTRTRRGRLAPHL